MPRMQPIPQGLASKPVPKPVSKRSREVANLRASVGLTEAR